MIFVVAAAAAAAAAAALNSSLEEVDLQTLHCMFQ